MPRMRLIPVLLVLFTAACPPSFATPAADREASLLTVHDGAIRDSSGRQVFLWGVNVGEKSSALRHQSWHGPEDFRNLRRWGMNAVRLLIFWSAVEPEPGRYDDSYLALVDQRIDWARDAGLYVILDMHQDLWSESIPGGNGAPAWATLDDDRPHFTIGDIWSTAYYVSPRVHRAFDSFWNNAPGPDGIGIQDRFALAWQHVAQRYARRPEVIGFDLMNEPFPGSLIDVAAAALLVSLPEILEDTVLPATWSELAASIEENPLPPWLLDALDSPKRHRLAVEALRPAAQRFEQNLLMPMYRRVHVAIREVHPTGIFFLEPCVLANVGVPTSIEALRLPDGTCDPLQAYMPHAYDIVTDTDLVGRPSAKRLSVIVDQKCLDAEELGMPLLVGEWGAYYNSRGTRRAARIMSRLLEKHTCGGFYWEYHRDLDQAVYFEGLSRPAPLHLAGKGARFGNAPDSGIFTCRWESAPGEGDSLFALPPSWSARGMEMHIEPAELAARIEPDAQDPTAFNVVVSSPDKPTAATLTMVAPPAPEPLVQ